MSMSNIIIKDLTKILQRYYSNLGIFFSYTLEINMSSHENHLFFFKGKSSVHQTLGPFGVQKKHRLSKSFRETREAVFFPESQQTFFWGPGQFGRYMDVSLNGGFSPQIIHFHRVFHYKAIHFGVPLFLETPIWTAGCLLYFFGTFPRSIHP